MRGGETVLSDGPCPPLSAAPPHRDGDRPNYSGKHNCHGLHVLALADERGRMIWFSAALPGRTHDITAARSAVTASCPTYAPRAAGLAALADLGLLGPDNDPDNPMVVTG